MAFRKIENSHTGALEQSSFSLMEGWSDEMLTQLPKRSNEPIIQSSTPRDSNERFIDAEATKAWHEKSPKVVYGLFHAAELAGVTWYSRQTKADVGEYTMAIRLYNTARGKGLALPMLMASEIDFRAQSGYHDAVWLETDATNHAARRLYENAGYQTVSGTDRILMKKAEEKP